MSTLRRTLESRAQDVLHSVSDTVLGNLQIFFDFLNDNLMTKTILSELMSNLPDPKPLIEKMQQTRRISLPSTYKEKVQSCLSILLHMIKVNEEPWQLMCDISDSHDTNVITREAVAEFFVPIYKYIAERMESIGSFQYLLVRFKAKSEWFDQSKLFGLYSNNTGKGESVLDNALREYLFEQGIDFPFSKPSSPSGEVDVLSLIESKPVPLEIKVFDGDGKSKHHIKQGFIQAYSYAKDYVEPSGYLVVFNVSPYDLRFELVSKENPQRIVFGDKTIFVFTINLYPHEEPASKRKLTPYPINETYLKEEDKQQAVSVTMDQE